MARPKPSAEEKKVMNRAKVKRKRKEKSYNDNELAKNRDYKKVSIDWNYAN